MSHLEIKFGMPVIYNGVKSQVIGDPEKIDFNWTVRIAYFPEPVLIYLLEKLDV